MAEPEYLRIPDKLKLSEEYQSSYAGRVRALSDFQKMVSEALSPLGLHPILKSRVKSFESWYAKKLRYLKKAYTEKSAELPINDILAIRVVCPFLGDLDSVEKRLSETFSIVEIERKGAERSYKEFGYESIHLLVQIPSAVQCFCGELERKVIEIQLRTILQEAWAEVEHELVYKAEFNFFDEAMKRKLAALNANLTLSDIIFQEILSYEKRLTNELEKRRTTFYQKIEEVEDTPELLRAVEEKGKSAKAPPVPVHLPLSQTGTLYEENAGADMDSLLLKALELHNTADFVGAIGIYTKILEQNSDDAVKAIVFKHRGMANFAQSNYREASEDFSACLRLDPEAYKALYYRGVVKAVLGDLRGALDDFSTVLVIHPYHFFARYRRALCWYRLGDFAAAHLDDELALRIEPDNQLAVRLMDRIKAKLARDEF